MDSEMEQVGRWWMKVSQVTAMEFKRTRQSQEWAS